MGRLPLHSKMFLLMKSRGQDHWDPFRMEMVAWKYFLFRCRDGIAEPGKAFSPAWRALDRAKGGRKMGKGELRETGESEGFQERSWNTGEKWKKTKCPSQHPCTGKWEYWLAQSDWRGCIWRAGNWALSSLPTQSIPRLYEKQLWGYFYPWIQGIGSCYINSWAHLV